MLNLVTLVGRIGGPVTNATSKQGTHVTKFSLATTSAKYNPETGQYTEDVQWHGIVCFGKLAEKAATWQKGDTITLYGEIRYNSYLDEQTGAKRFYTEIVPDNAKRISKAAADTTTPNTTPEPQAAPATVAPDDLPF